MISLLQLIHQDNEPSIGPVPGQLRSSGLPGRQPALGLLLPEELDVPTRHTWWKASVLGAWRGAVREAAPCCRGVPRRAAAR